MGSISRIIRPLDLLSDAEAEALGQLVTKLTPRITRHQRVEFQRKFMRTLCLPARHVEEFLVTGRHNQEAGLIGSDHGDAGRNAIHSPLKPDPSVVVAGPQSNGSVDIGISECPESPS